MSLRAQHYCWSEQMQPNPFTGEPQFCGYVGHTSDPKCQGCGKSSKTRTKEDYRIIEPWLVEVQHKWAKRWGI